jgi:hypothetical protein
MTVHEVVAGADLKTFTIKFRQGSPPTPINLTGGAVRLQGQSADLPDVDVDAAGTIVDGLNGLGRWQIGSVLSPADLAGKPSATFNLRAKFTDVYGASDWTSEFQIKWVAPPIMEGEVDVESAQFRALSILNHDITRFDHSAPLTIDVGGKRSTGYVDHPKSTSRGATTAVGADKIFEVLYTFPGVYPWVEQDLFKFPTTVRMVMGHGTLPSVKAGECFMGIEIGTFLAFPPWQSNFTANAVVQLRYNFTLERWEICIYDADGVTPPDVVPCDINPSPTNVNLELALEWVPNFADPSQNRLTAYLNRKVAALLVGGRLANLIGAPNDENQAGYFVTNGSDPSAIHTIARFYWGAAQTTFDWSTL